MNLGRYSWEECVRAKFGTDRGLLDGRRRTNKGGLTQRLLATYSHAKGIRNPLLRSVVKSLARILVISFTIKNGDHRGQKELFLNLPVLICGDAHLC